MADGIKINDIHDLRFFLQILFSSNGGGNNTLLGRHLGGNTSGEK